MYQSHCRQPVVRQRPIRPVYQRRPDSACVLPISSTPHFYAAGGIAKFSLGLSSCTSDPNLHCTTSAPYWNDIRLALRKALGSHIDLGYELRRAISYSESAHNKVFDCILRKEVLAAQCSNETPKKRLFSSMDPVFAAARGAAIITRFCPMLPIPRAGFPDLRPKPQGW